MYEGLFGLCPQLKDLYAFQTEQERIATVAQEQTRHEKQHERHQTRQPFYHRTTKK